MFCYLDEKIYSVEETLLKTNLIKHPRIIVFNKIDLISEEEIESIKTKYSQPVISSLKSEGITELRKFIEDFINSNSRKKEAVNI